jgi:AcrR family transcriptional regulator
MSAVKAPKRKKVGCPEPSGSGSLLNRDIHIEPVCSSNSTTAERLRKAAAQLFWRKGYTATTARELATLLGIQRASLYYHMTKDLLYALCVESLENIHSAVERAVVEVDDPMERVRALIGAHVSACWSTRKSTPPCSWSYGRSRQTGAAK